MAEAWSLTQTTKSHWPKLLNLHTRIGYDQPKAKRHGCAVQYVLETTGLGVPSNLLACIVNAYVLARCANKGAIPRFNNNNVVM